MDLIEIDTHGVLDDCEFFSFSYLRENKLLIELITWNYNRAIFVFEKPIAFIDSGNERFTQLCYGPKDSPVMQKALEGHYVKVPEEHPYKLFQFFGFEERPFYEIVCEEFSLITNSCSPSQVTMTLKRQVNEQDDLNKVAQWASMYLVNHVNDLSFELREILHCISLMKIYPELKISKEELLQVVEETYVDVNDFGKPRPKPMTKKIIDRTYRFIQGL